MEKHVPGILAAVFAFAFFGVALWFSGLVRPGHARVAKPEGLSSDKPSVRISARYQVLLSAAALFFFGFLVLFPVVASFRKWIDEGRGSEALVLIGIFLGTMSIALAYAWMKGDLSWSGSTTDKGEHGNPRKRIS
jgi:NADH:ubiquinone oxidoreductase subunit 3 (subunit A)